MKKLDKFKKKFKDYMFDHYSLQTLIEYSFLMLVTIFSAVVYSFGFSAFITPVNSDSFEIVTGGISGLAQNMTLIFKMCGITLSENIFQSIFYFFLNMPLIIFGYIKIGKRCSIFSFVNVIISSIFVALFSNQLSEFTKPIAEIVQTNDLSRVFFAGITAGISSGICYKVNITSGGMDIVSYYFSLKKSTGTGKYTIILNIGTITLYTILMMISSPDSWAQSFVALGYSVAYLFIVGLVIDLINVREKKVQMQIITTNKNMAEVLLSYFQHGATILNGKGAYSNEDKIIIDMIVSSIEVNKVMTLANKIDSHSFITATPIDRVLGNFFIKPVK